MSARGYRIPIDVVRDTFADRYLEDFLANELPGGRFEGSEFVCGSVAGEGGRSMSVCLRGPRRGLWKDFAGPSDHHGDVIDLVRHVLFGGNKADAIRWMIGYCGLDDTSHEDIAQRRAQARKRAERRRAEDEKQAREMRARAFQMWKFEASAELAGTPVEKYLNGRGILLDLMSSSGSLRYHPALYSSEARRRYPAMVALIVNAAGQPLAAHRTWLEVQQDGSVKKARLQAAKKVLGLYKGGYISIAKGTSGKPLSAAPAGEHVAIAEGIEDCLTAAMIWPDARIMAGISLDNLRNVPVPASCGRLTIIGDNDEGRAQRAKLQAAAQAHLARGIRDVRVFVPDGFKDLNELHQAAQRRAG